MKTRFQPKYNIRKGDQVVVIAGDDKDLSTPHRVLEVIINKEDPNKTRVLVEGVKVVTKHRKPTAQNPNGGLVQEEAPIHISNVMLFDAATSAGARVSRTRTEVGYTRNNRKTGQAIK